MYYEGMIELLAMHVVFSGGKVVTNGHHWMIQYGEEMILCSVPESERDLRRLISDLAAAGLPWPPVSG